MASLGHQDQESKKWTHLCEGSIISNRIIITSGDCLDYINEDMIIKDVETKLQISGLVMSTSRMNMKRLTFTLKFTLVTALKNMIPTLL